MTKKNKTILIKRAKSFGWSTGMMVAAVTVDFLAKNLGLFDMPEQLTVVIGLVLAQVSKYLNTR